MLRSLGTVPRPFSEFLKVPYQRLGAVLDLLWTKWLRSRRSFPDWIGRKEMGRSLASEDFYNANTTVNG
jgi:hypothetical protein